jgi:hypothetical protein
MELLGSRDIWRRSTHIHIPATEFGVPSRKADQNSN